MLALIKSSFLRVHLNRLVRFNSIELDIGLILYCGYEDVNFTRSLLLCVTVSLLVLLSLFNQVLSHLLEVEVV
jgi:hypothetical protein